MNLETVIQEKVHALPTFKQEKVLEFIEVLASEESNLNGKTEKTQEEKRQGRLALIGIGRSKGSGDISQRAEEILAKEINKRSGWTLKEKIVAD